MVRYHFVVVFLVISTLGISQGTVEDYKRAISIRDTYKDKVSNTPEEFHWIDSTVLCWYINNVGDENEYLLLNAEEASQRVLFDHKRLSDSLSVRLDKEVSVRKLRLEEFEIREDLAQLTFKIDSAKFTVSLTDYSCKSAEVELPGSSTEWPYWGNSRDELGNDPVDSPDKKWTASIREYNVWVKENRSGKAFQLSYDGSAGEFYSSYIQWSPDSRHFVTCRVNPAEKRFIQFVESSPKDQLEPKLQQREYLKPGDELTQQYPQLFSIGQKKQLLLPTAGIQDQFSVENIVWRKDGSGFTFEYNQRGHQRYEVIRVDTLGNWHTALVERSATFIDYSGKKFRHDIEKTHEIIWASERDGWNHLYLYDGKSGKVRNQITAGQWVVREVVYVDETQRQVIFTAGGFDKNQDPYQVHYFRVGFDGKNLVRLTTEDGNHRGFFSGDYRYFIDQYSRIDTPPVTLLRDALNGKVLAPLQTGDDSRLVEAGWKRPVVFKAKGRDGKTDIWGTIIRPSNLDTAKKYPVVEFIYAGPHSAFVPKDFNNRYQFYLYEMAELGFIVVQMDGMGTSLRSKAFHDVCYQNIKDAGFPDRKLWIEAAAKEHSYMDIERVGIYGTSAGGQNAAGALVFHSDFYDVAVSSCGCHDNRMDKIWWNEQFMGKIGPHYEASSNVVNASQLQGDLMLIVGEVDDNVDPATTMQLADALIKANKQFELVVIPGANHTSGGAYGERKRKDFFVRHLLGVDPPSWEEVYDK